MAKIMRRVLCILGVCGLFSIYQFDAVAKTYDEYNNCTQNSYAGKYCKHMGANQKKCPAGCYCEGHTKTHTDPIDVTAICAGTKNADTLEKQHMDDARMYRCPDGYTSNQQKDKKTDCYFRCPYGSSYSTVNYDDVELAKGEYLDCAVRKSCSSIGGASAENHYCPGGIYSPSPYKNDNSKSFEVRYPGFKPCLSGSKSYVGDSRKTCKITCNSGYYMVRNTNSVSCVACPVGYACDGGTLVVLGPDAVNSDSHRHRCTGNTFADVTGLSTCKLCEGPNVVYQQRDGKNVLLNVGCGDPLYAPNVGNGMLQLCVAPKITCPSGKYLGAHGTNTSYCRDCDAGYYCPGGECFGTTSPANNTPQGRHDCGAGKYSAQGAWKVEQCIACTGATYAPGPNSTQCDPCPQTSYVNAEHSTCTPCATGYEQDPDDPTSCKAKTFTAHYDCNGGGSYSGTTTATYGETFTPEPGTVCTAPQNHSFGGWKIGGVTCTPTCQWSWTGDRTLVAQWPQGPAPKYTIQYNCGDGGTGNPAAQPDIETGQSVHIHPATACTKSGYHFSQWVSASGNVGPFNAGGHYPWGNSNETLSPDWAADTPNGCNVTYNCNNGNNGESQQAGGHYSAQQPFYVAPGTICTPPTNTPVFEGWKVGNTPVENAQYTCAGTDITFVAQWGAAPITSCNAGQYLSNGQCNDCAAGYYSNGGNVTSCTPCDPGKYASQPGSTSCSPCEGVDEYSAAGAGACSNCDNGTVDANHTTCTPCASGMIPNANHNGCEPSPITSCNVKYACGEGSAKSGATLVYNNQSSPFTVKDVDSLCNAPNGKEFNGWNPTATAGDQYTCTGATVEFTAQWTNTTPNGTTCGAGYYLPANETECALCPIGDKCPSAGVYQEQNSDQGNEHCTGNEYTSVQGSETCEVCNGTVSGDSVHNTGCTPAGTGGGGNGTNHTCAAGSYLSANNVCTSCSGLTGYFCPGGTYTGASVRKGAYACLAGGVQNSGGASCTVVLSGDQLLKGLATGEDCWLKANIADYVNCMMTGVHNP